MLLNVQQVIARLGISRPGFYKLLKNDPTFPPALYVTPRSPRWREEAIEAWIDSRARPRAA